MFILQENVRESAGVANSGIARRLSVFTVTSACVFRRAISRSLILSGLIPERAHRGLDTLSEMRALMAAVFHLARDETKAATNPGRSSSSPERACAMTKIAEPEIHAIVLSCARARRQMLAVLPATKPTQH